MKQFNRNAIIQNLKEKYDQKLQAFIEKAKQTHGDKYDYSKVIYIDSLTSVQIYCKKHNEYFSQQPASHVRGRGCPKCGFERGSEKRSYTNEQFIEKIKSIQGNKWDYSKVNYTSFETKVKLICKEHGEFFKNPRDLISKETGCPLCCSRNIPYTTEEFIKKAYEINGDKYDYSYFKYTNAKTKSLIVCKKHGVFLSSPNGVLIGYGCPTCKSSKGELLVYDLLKKHQIQFEEQYSLPNSRYRYDFYLPEYHIFIEFHGRQHYEYIEFFHGSKEEFESRKIIDDIKKELVKAHKGKLIVIHYRILQSGLLDKYLKRQLIRHGVPSTAFTN